jgi:DNA-binding NarL/FixJ family response regulator
LLKTASGQEIVRAIRSALNGRHTIASTVAQQLASHTKDEALTEREIAVLCRVAEGRSNKEIADALFISEDTVKARMKTIMGKLGAEDRTHAVIIAMRRGFFDSMP